MKIIPLSQEQFAKVDDEDYDFLMQWKWHCNFIRAGYYACRGVRAPKISKGVYGATKKILMHRIIMNATLGKVVDHVDHDTLNNQKLNLRICTYSENSRNSISKRKFKGVHRITVKGHIYFQAKIKCDYKDIYLGCFKTEAEAASCYNQAAKKHHREFASLNTIPS